MSKLFKIMIYKIFIINIVINKICIKLMNGNFDKYINLYFIYFKFLNKIF